VWWIKEPLDLARMRTAAQSFQGMHDFASFAADEPGEKSTTVLVDRLDIVEDGDLVLIRIIGSHFLWRMVRRMVGVLAAVGRGDLSADDVTRLLTSSSDLPGTLTAPASGLFLEAVYYKGDPPPGPLKAVATIPS
jgi:tRNA pseudouridine38-40 synthase